MLLKSFGLFRVVAVILIAALVFAAIPAAEVHAADICVDPSGGGCYTTIQAAIDAAADGDTITIAAGTYVENPKNGTISPEILGKQLNFIGAVDGSGAPATTIQGALMVSLDNSMSDNIRIENIHFVEVGSIDGLVLYGVNGATVSNCSFTGSGFASLGRAILLDRGASNGNSGIIVENSSFTGGYNSAIQGYTSGLTVRNSTIDQTRSGINFQGGGNLVVQDTDISITAQDTTNAYGIRFSSSTSVNMTVSGGSISLDKNGLTPDVGSYHSAIIIRAAAEGTLQVHETTVLGEVVNLSSRAVDATRNYWGSAAGPESGIIQNLSTGSIAYTPWCLDASCVFPVQNVTQGTSFSTIQSAINAANAGDTITVAAGTYDEENIVITKGLTLQGAGAAVTHIAPSTVTNNSTIVVSNPTGNVLIDGFTFDMQPKPNYGSAVVVTGTVIPVDSATVTISNNVINGSNDGGKSDYGFYGQGNNAAIVISNNVINKTGDNSICMEQQIGSTTVSDNTIYITDNVDYNPYFSMAYGGKIITTPQIIEGNTFYMDHAGTGWSEAITFVAAALGNWNNDPADIGGYRDVRINNNVIYGGGERARGIGIFDNSHADGQGTISGLVISENIFTGENATDPNTIGIYLYGDVEGASITGNSVDGVLSGVQLLQGLKNTVYPSGAVISENKITNTGTAINWAGTSTLNASPNWFGSAAGPAVGSVTGLVTYAPWCADEDCTTFAPVDGRLVLPSGVTEAEIQQAINNAPAGTTIVIPAGTYNFAGGYTIDNPSITILLSDGVIIENNSPCFVVNASYTRITTESIGGAVCLPTGTSNGIDVAAGLTNVIIEGLEINGTNGTDGINFAGAITDVQIVNNYIHNLGGNGVTFTTAPSGFVEIQGNLFKDNTEYGVSAPSDFNVTYNSWGSVDGPNGTGGDGISGITSFSPWTHVDLSMASSGTPWANNVLPGYTITYTVSGNFVNAMGADFDLKYPATLLNLDSTTEGTAFNLISLNTDETTGTISFAGYAKDYIPVNGTQTLFTATFTAAATGGAGTLNFDDAADAFSMAPASGSSNNIYAAALADGAVNVITAFPTLTAQDLDVTFAQGYGQEFDLIVNNPTTGVAYADPQFNFTLPVGTVLEFNDGGTWTTVASGVVDLPAPLANDGTDQTYTFRVTFPEAGTVGLSVNLVDASFDPDAVLASYTKSDIVVNSNYTVTGTFSMQGRTVRSGIPVTLTMVSPALYGPFDAMSLDIISGNTIFTNVPVAGYVITTNQPRYLDVTVDLAKTKAVSANTTLAALELKGGDATDDNVVYLGDASAIGGQYGDTGAANNGDVNFSNVVDVFDLAIVGGNYGLTSADAYGAWIP